MAAESILYQNDNPGGMVTDTRMPGFAASSVPGNSAVNPCPPGWGTGTQVGSAPRLPCHLFSDTADRRQWVVAMWQHYLLRHGASVVLPQQVLHLVPHLQGSTTFSYFPWADAAWGRKWGKALPPWCLDEAWPGTYPAQPVRGLILIVFVQRKFVCNSRDLHCRFAKHAESANKNGFSVGWLSVLPKFRDHDPLQHSFFSYCRPSTARWRGRRCRLAVNRSPAWQQSRPTCGAAACMPRCAAHCNLFFLRRTS